MDGGVVDEFQGGPGRSAAARRPGPAAAASGTTRRGRRSPAARDLMATPGTAAPAPGAAAGIGDGATARRSGLAPAARAARARPARTLNEPVSTNSRFAASRRCSASLVMGCSGPWSASAIRASRRASRAFRAMRFAFS